MRSQLGLCGRQRLGVRRAAGQDENTEYHNLWSHHAGEVLDAAIRARLVCRRRRTCAREARRRS